MVLLGLVIVVMFWETRYPDDPFIEVDVNGCGSFLSFYDDKDLFEVDPVWNFIKDNEKIIIFHLKEGF